MRAAVLLAVLGFALNARAEGALARLEPSAAADRIDVREVLPERDTLVPSRPVLDCLVGAREGRLAIETELRHERGGVVLHLFVDASAQPTYDLEQDELLTWARRPDPSVSTALDALTSGTLSHEELADLVSRMNAAIRDDRRVPARFELRPVVRLQWQCAPDAPWHELRFGYRDFGPGSPAWQIENVLRTWTTHLQAARLGLMAPLTARPSSPTGSARPGCSSRSARRCSP